MANFKVATKYTQPLQVDIYTFVPGVIYNDTGVDFSNDFIAGALYKGDLVFTDNTSLSELQGNTLVKDTILTAGDVIGIDYTGGGVIPNPVP